MKEFSTICDVDSATSKRSASANPPLEPLTFYVDFHSAF